MYFRLLGSVRVELKQHTRDGELCDDGLAHDGSRVTPIPIEGDRKKTILSLLLINRGRAVSIDRLVDGVWSDMSPPNTCRKQVQNATAAIRRTLHKVSAETEQIPAANAVTISYTSAGYILHTSRANVDALAFEDAVGRILRNRTSEDERAVRALRSALALWTGSPFEELSAIELRAEAARLEELRLLVIEELTSRELNTLSDSALHIPELLSLTRQYPERERLWLLLMDALHRCGRTAEALAWFRHYQAHLLEGHGLRPGSAIREKERQLLLETG